MAWNRTQMWSGVMPTASVVLTLICVSSAETSFSKSSRLSLRQAKRSCSSVRGRGQGEAGRGGPCVGEHRC